jgi:hypothetical protein
MNAQYILVTLILLGAVSYASLVFWKKTRSFSPKSDCGSDCGCGDTKKPRGI